MKKYVAYAMSAALVIALGSGCASTKKTKKTSSTAAAMETTNAKGPDMKNYLVRSGESLWSIAGKSSVLADSFQWPLLFKTNRDQIEDPDIIEVRQDLNYKEAYSREEIREAVGKAKETPAYVPHSKPRRVLPVKY